MKVVLLTSCSSVLLVPARIILVKLPAAKTLNLTLKLALVDKSPIKLKTPSL